jgi:hypothetical protein
MSEIGDLATRIVNDEFDYLTGSERTAGIQKASGWLTNNIGTLNTLLFQSFSGENPSFGLEEASIYRYLYLGNYYSSKAASVLRNMDSSTLEWLQIREGDSSIQVQNKNEVAKSFRQFSRDMIDEANKLVTAYNIYQASPRQVSVNYFGNFSDAENQDILLSAFDISGSYASIPSGQDSIFVPLSLDEKPKSIALALVKPSSNSSSVSYVIRGDVEANGFTVDLGGKVRENGYKIGYILNNK